MRILFAVVGWFCIVLGACSALFAVYAFVDPASAQMSNDAAPFGDPPSRSQIAFQFVFSLLVTLIGTRMVLWRRKRP
ncbi:MAG TPA: hypothetical protein VJ806_10140 [Luteimonas sp.]|nr:hypothetical protein [Luteimonas sp.]